MKTSQLYNTEKLVKLFACFGALHYVVSTCDDNWAILSIFLAPIGASIFYLWMTFDEIKTNVVQWESIVILAFVADGIFRSVRILLCQFKKRSLRSQLLSQWNLSRTTVLLFWPSMYLTAYVLFGSKTWLQPEFVMGVALMLTVYYLAFLSISLLPEDLPFRHRVECGPEVNFVSWIIVLLPFIVVGDLYAALKGFHSLFPFIFLVVLAVRFALAVHVSSIATKNPSKLGAPIYRTMIWLLRVVTMVYGCWNLFTLHVHEEILLHPLPGLVMAATICDVVEFIIQV